MKVLINSYQSRKQERDDFISPIIGKWISNNPELQISSWGDAESLDWIKSTNVQKVIFQPSRIALLRQKQAANKLRETAGDFRPDLIIQVGFPIRLEINLPQVAVLPDDRFEQFTPGNKKLSQKTIAAFSEAIQSIDSFICYSQFAAGILTNRFGIDSQKILVTGIPNLTTTKQLNWEEKQAIKDQYASGKEFFLYEPEVLNSEETVAVLKAFTQFKNRQQSNMQLMLLPGNKDSADSFQSKLSTYKFRQHVILINETDRELNTKLLAAAYGYIHIDATKGFDKKVSAAMALGVPIITTGQQTEPGKNLVLQAVSKNPESIAEHLKQLYKAEYFREELVSKSIEAAAAFSPESILDKTAAFISKLVSNGSPNFANHQNTERG